VASHHGATIAYLFLFILVGLPLVFLVGARVLPSLSFIWIVTIVLRSRYALIIPAPLIQLSMLSKAKYVVVRKMPGQEVSNVKAAGEAPKNLDGQYAARSRVSSLMEHFVMNKNHLVLFAALLTGTAQAGILVDGVWNSSRCGAKPVVANVDLRDPDAYNKSVDKVTAYQKDINTYLNCIVSEGNLDIQLISKSITDEQLAAKTAREKILADVKKANEKFDGK